MLRSFLSISFHTCYILWVFTIRQHYRAFGSTINAAKDSELYNILMQTCPLVKQFAPFLYITLYYISVFLRAEMDRKHQ